MSLREDLEVTKIESYPAGQIRVTKRETIYKGDEVISDRDIIVLYNPGDSMANETDVRVQNIARATWSQELINQYKTDSTDTGSRN